MPFVAAPNCVQVAMIGTQDDEPVENTWHYRLPAPATLDDLFGLLTVIQNWAVANPINWPTNVSILKFYLRALDSAGAPVLEQDIDTPLDGTRAGEVLPNDVTFSVTRHCGLAGRRNRGRLYMIGITNSDLSGANTIKAAQANAFVSSYNALRLAMEAATPAAEEIILHRATGTHTDVIGYRYADLFLDSQRRRLPAHNVHR